MAKQDLVLVGSRWWARVTGRMVVVQIEAIDYSRLTGRWRAEALNLSTGKRITIRSAQRLRSSVPVAPAPQGDPGPATK
jgi:hypothetical protein